MAWSTLLLSGQMGLDQLSPLRGSSRPRARSAGKRENGLLSEISRLGGAGTEWRHRIVPLSSSHAELDGRWIAWRTDMSASPSRLPSTNRISTLRLGKCIDEHSTNAIAEEVHVDLPKEREED